MTTQNTYDDAYPVRCGPGRTSCCNCLEQDWPVSAGGCLARLSHGVNRLTGKSSALNINYQYNAAGQRTNVALTDGSYWSYGYDALGQLTSGSLQGAGGVSGAISMTVSSGTNAGTYFYCFGGNGNVVALVNAVDGAIAAQYEYGPFGELIRATGPMAKVNPFMFSTKFYDWETGLYYYGYRYYNPSTGRWLSRDPMEEEGGVNLYGFVSNDGVNTYDLLGFQTTNPSPQPNPSPRPNPSPQPNPPPRPLPPLQTVVADPTVSAAIDSAWNASNPNGPAADRHEHGFWILRDNRRGTYIISNFPTGSGAQITPGATPVSSNQSVVGFFHTHPNPTNEGYILGPSPADVNFARTRNVPGVLRANDGLHFFGPTNTAPPPTNNPTGPHQERICPQFDAI